VADYYDEFQKMGVEIYSVSTDTHFTHKAWHDSSETSTTCAKRWVWPTAVRSSSIPRASFRLSK
jgi:alkyl hydroperoxide reductase subunit AhpC